MPKIIITIPRDPTKGTTVEVDGVSGPGCTKLTEKIEAALGKTTGQELKEEYNEAGQGQDLDLLQ